VTETYPCIAKVGLILVVWDIMASFAGLVVWDMMVLTVSVVLLIPLAWS